MRQLSALLLSTAMLAACQQGGSYDNNPNTYKGAGIGAVAGGAIGAATGDNERERWTRGAIGAGIGALAGGAIGQYMDNQEAEMRRQLEGSGVNVSRQGDNILLNMPNSITFNFDSATINPQFIGTLDDLAGVLVQYPDTMVDVMGHTDNVGTDAYNMTLSENRALAVSSYLISRGVANSRVRAYGLGESQPVASNATESGRAQNRRVEVLIRPVNR